MIRRALTPNSDEESARDKVLDAYVRTDAFQSIIDWVGKHGIAKSIPKPCVGTVGRTSTGQLRLESANEPLLKAVRRAGIQIDTIHANPRRRRR